MRHLILILLLSSSLHATHIIGGNLKITQTATNSFRINLDIFKDCRPGTADLSSIYVRVFQQDNYSVYKDVLLNVPLGDTLHLGNKCYTPPALCVQEYHLSNVVNLANHAAGYLFVAQVCCRNSIIDNINFPDQTGITWTATIPDPMVHNSTPDLGAYPPSGFLCLNYTRTLDLSAHDPDGDHLVYELVDPYDAPQPATISPPASPPYNSVSWKPGYSAANAIHGSPDLQIDPNTGILKCKPNQLGLYVFAYSVSEYRNGVKIGEVRRDLQLEVLPCTIDFPPVFIEPTDSVFNFSAEQENCINISVVDSNLTDTVYLLSRVHSNLESSLASVPSQLKTSGIGIANGKICWTPNCFDAVNGHKILLTLTATSGGCDEDFVLQKEITFNIPPPAKQLQKLIPNVFTPNGDNVNDIYRLATSESLPCLEDLYIRIFNRWGTLVYENTLNAMNWDGTYQGHMLSSGVYFYIASGSYGAQPLEIKGFLTLNR